MVRSDTTTLNLDRKMSPAYRALAARERRLRYPEITDQDPYAHEDADLIRDIMQHIASAQESTPSWNWRVVIASGLHAIDDPSTLHFSSDRLTPYRPAQVDWDRWHELRSIRDSRPMNPSEQREYKKFEAIVAELDAKDEARSTAALDLLEEKHARVISSIERLTEAVRKAAQRDR